MAGMCKIQLHVTTLFLHTEYSSAKNKSELHALLQNLLWHVCCCWLCKSVHGLTRLFLPQKRLVHETTAIYTWSSDEKMLTTPVALVEWSRVNRSRNVTWSCVMRLSTITFHSSREARLVTKKSGVKNRSKASFLQDFLVTWNPLRDASNLEEWA